MAKSCVKSVLFFINFTLQFLQIYSEERVQILPVSVISIPGNTTTFTCESSFLLVDIIWKLNGTQLEDPNDYNITTTFDGRRTGSLTWNLLESKYNSTTIQCLTNSVVLGRPITNESALLLVQGLLGPVDDLVVDFSGVYLNISWSPPFSLPVPGIDSSVSNYCVDIYARKLSCSDPDLLYSECAKYVMNNFNLFIPLEYQCSEINASVVPVNFEGNGTRLTAGLGRCSRKGLVQCPPAEAPLNGLLGSYSSKVLEEGTLVSYTCDSSYIPSPVAYHAICTNNGTWSPDPANVMCKFIPTCAPDEDKQDIIQSNFTRLNNPSVAEVVISVGAACFVGGCLVAFVVLTLAAQKGWVRTIISPRSKEISKKTSAQKLLDESSRTQKSTDQQEPKTLHPMFATLKTTIRILTPSKKFSTPQSFKTRSPLVSLKPLKGILFGRRSTADQRPDTEESSMDEPIPELSKPSFSRDFYSQKTTSKVPSKIISSSGHTQAGSSEEKARDFYSRKFS